MSRTFLILFCALVALTTVAQTEARSIFGSTNNAQQLPIAHHTPRHHRYVGPSHALSAPSAINITLFANTCQDPTPIQVIAAVSEECYFIPAWNQSVKLTIENPDDQQYFIMFYNSSTCIKTSWIVGWGDYGTGCFTEAGYSAGVSQLITSPYGYALYGETQSCQIDQVIHQYGIVPGSCWDSGWSSEQYELYNTLDVDPSTGLYNLAYWNDSACTQIAFNELGLLGECFQNWKVFNASVPLELPLGHTHCHQSQVPRAPTRLQVRYEDEVEISSMMKEVITRQTRRISRSSTNLDVFEATPAVKFDFFQGSDCNGTPAISYNVPSGSCFPLNDLTQSVLYTLDPNTDAYSVSFFMMSQCNQQYIMTSWNNTGNGCFEESDIAVQITQL